MRFTIQVFIVRAEPGRLVCGADLVRSRRWVSAQADKHAAQKFQARAQRSPGYKLPTIRFAKPMTGTFARRNGQPRDVICALRIRDSGQPPEW